MTATLLIIDDEPMIRRTLRYQFEQLRWDVHEASTGGEGIEAAVQCAPDVVLLDVRLPDADGLDVLLRLHEVSPASTAISTSPCAVMTSTTLHGLDSRRRTRMSSPSPSGSRTSSSTTSGITRAAASSPSPPVVASCTSQRSCSNW